MEQRIVIKNKPKQNRLRYLDSGRALASFAGIIFHAALMFSAQWIPTFGAENQIEELTIYTEYINVFRMPLFLFISGYFSIAVLSSKGVKGFLDNRLKRIGIPLLSTMILLNLLQSFVCNYLLSDKTTFDGWVKELLPWSSNFTFYHVWYLYYILAFSGVLLVINYKKLITSKIEKLCNYNVYCLDFMLLIFTVSIGFAGLVLQNIIMYHPIIAISNMATYLPYFLMGYACYVNKNLLERLIIKLDTKRALYLCFMLVASMSVMLILPSEFKYLTLLVKLTSRYYSFVFVIYLLRKFLNKENKVIKYMSRASYGVYLFHQPIIIMFGYIYIKYYSNVSPYVGFFAVLISSIIVTYLLEWAIIKNTKVGMFLFNGQWTSKQKISNRAQNYVSRPVRSGRVLQGHH